MRTKPELPEAQAGAGTAAMAARVTIPLVPLLQTRERLPLLQTSRAFEQLAGRFSKVALREPPTDDAARWHEHTLGAQRLRFAQPLTFTPYASARPCSARCRFCSETLVDETAEGALAAALRPDPGYFAALRRALGALRGVPLSYSLSGLESTDDPAWLLGVLDTLRAARADGPLVSGTVMYSNGAGFVDHAARLLPALESFGLSWLEWSRHHDHAEANQQIMRFRPGQRIAQQATFEAAVRAAVQRFPVKLVCVVQRGGIVTPVDVFRYVDWAHGLGVDTVIFREFSELPAHYRHNATRRYIDGARVTIDDLLLGCIDDKRFLERYTPLALTGGYYFWNARWARDDGREVVFERSDYGTMLEHEARGLIYKLVFHANGHLCSGWQPERGVLWRSDDSQ
ncbi:hypothetical protein [Paraburkholderia phenazinium]|uniref:hypothetical protein n=1 Tax=Paraburkholderia phenazinium TaxID=60549 RepID=UPI001FC819E3|nr:hypothetical protein [Paraburkholderia phenazinium]